MSDVVLKLIIYVILLATTPASPQSKQNNRTEPDAEQESSPLPASRSDSSLNATFEVISEAEITESAIQQLATPTTQDLDSQATRNVSGSNLFSTAFNPQSIKKSRHILKEGLI